MTLENAIITGRKRSALVAVISAVCILFALAAYGFLWIRHLDQLAVGIDGEYNVWLTYAYRMWGYPLGSTAINPLQGMVSMQVAINPYFDPAAWFLGKNVPNNLGLVLSFAIYFAEVWATGYLLARCIGFPKAYSFFGSFWLVVLIFPPSNYALGIPGWMSGATLFANTISLSNIALAAYACVGRRHHRASWTDLGLGLIILLCLVAILMAAPFYNAGILPGFAVLGAAIFLSSNAPRQFVARAGVGIAILACFVAVGLHRFFLDAQGYSLRFSSANAQNDWYSAAGQPAFLSALQGILCNWKIGCENWAVPVILNGNYWLQFSAIAGAFLCYFVRSDAPGRVGLHFAWIWSALMLFWLVQSAGLVTNSIFGPTFFLVLVYPILAFYSLFLVYGIGSLICRLFKTSDLLGTPQFTWCAVAVAGAAAVLAATFAGPGAPTPIRSWEARETAITRVLEENIALRAGQAFRGSVATVFGLPGGEMRPLLGMSAEEPAKNIGFGFKFLGLSKRATGNEHDANDLWWKNIPTLFEYGQAISYQLMFYVSRFLNRSDDFIEIHRAIPRLLNINIMRSMGVAFVITDRNLRDSEVTLAAETEIVDPASGGTAKLRLIRIPNTNVGDFSPTEIVPLPLPDEFASIVEHDPNILERRAFVESAVSLNATALVAATDARLSFENGGVHISARSEGRSALLLPVQFSHCYQAGGPSKGKVALVRANFLHILIIFDRVLDLNLRWNLSAFGYDGCRAKDTAELRRIGLITQPNDAKR